jgi:hypothetical protein
LGLAHRVGTLLALAVVERRFAAVQREALQLALVLVRRLVRRLVSAERERQGQQPVPGACVSAALYPFWSAWDMVAPRPTIWSLWS